MPRTIEWLVIAVCLIAVAVALLVVAGLLVSTIANRARAKEEADAQYRLRMRLLDLKRLCGWDFPVVRELCDHLINAVNAEGQVSSLPFVKEMRAKYGPKDTDIHASHSRPPVATAPTVGVQSRRDGKRW